jgi:hypothetical protein
MSNNMTLHTLKTQGRCTYKKGIICWNSEATDKKQLNTFFKFSSGLSIIKFFFDLIGDL